MAISTLNLGDTIDIAVENNAESILSVEVLESLDFIAASLIFNSSTKWESVIVVYEHSSGQNRRVIHKKVDNIWKGNVVFPPESQPGVWEKKKVIITDRVGAVITINREDIGVLEDLTIIN